jgi:hypothetical protein
MLEIGAKYGRPLSNLENPLASFRFVTGAINATMGRGVPGGRRLCRCNCVQFGGLGVRDQVDFLFLSRAGIS